MSEEIRPDFGPEKVCTKCKERKPLFRFSKSRRDGHSSWCKDCRTDSARRSYGKKKADRLIEKDQDFERIGQVMSRRRDQSYRDFG